MIFNTKVAIDGTNLNTARRKARAMQAAEELFIILNSREFKDEILSMPLKYRECETSEYRNISNLELYDMIMTAKEEWNNRLDFTVNIIVDDYYKRFSSVVGFMNPGRPKVWVNTKFFDTMNMMNVVSNFLHEYFHTLGFRHGGHNIRLSFPYFANVIVEKLYPILIEGREVEEQPTTPPVKGYWLCRRTWRTLWLRKKCRYIAG